MSANKIRKHRDVLESRAVEGADDFIDGEHGHLVPLVVKTAYADVKKELRRLSRVTKESHEGPVVKHNAPKKESNGHHPAITGLSVGGVKELIDWVLAIATQGDKYGQEFLQLSFIDGGITAIIAGSAAWLAKGSKK